MHTRIEGPWLQADLCLVLPFGAKLLIESCGYRVEVRRDYVSTSTRRRPGLRFVALDTASAEITLRARELIDVLPIVCGQEVEVIARGVARDGTRREWFPFVDRGRALIHRWSKGYADAGPEGTLDMESLGPFEVNSLGPNLRVNLSRPHQPI